MSGPMEALNKAVADYRERCPLPTSKRARVRYVEYVCRGERRHRFLCGVMIEQITTPSGKVDRELFRPSGAQGWMPLPICPGKTEQFVDESVAGGHYFVREPESITYEPRPIVTTLCSALADEKGSYDPALQQVRESERFVAWLSPDGERLAVPGIQSAPMPERYRKAGYVQVQAATIADLDRLDKIRARQTGNDAYNEMNFDPGARRFRDEAPYDADGGEKRDY